MRTDVCWGFENSMYEGELLFPVHTDQCATRIRRLFQ